MTQTPDQIHEVVREHYAERIMSNASCCGSSDGSTSCCSTDSNLYPADLLTTLPEGESAISYGCGDPITLASLQPGRLSWTWAPAQDWIVSSLPRRLGRRDT